MLVALFAAGLVSLAGIVVGLRGQAGGDEDHAAAARDPSVQASSRGAEFQGSIMPDGVRAPDFALRDQDGRPVRLRDLRGRPAIVTFLYTRCEQTCGPQAQQIKGALDRLEQPVPAVAIAVKPETDTPRSARRFLDEQGMTGRMRFALGSRRRLAPVWKGFAIQPQLARAEHQARIVLLDGRGFQRVGFPIDQATPERIAHDVRVLARQGAAG